jgi:tetratricopeptide (TPR) repeat protein
VTSSGYRVFLSHSSKDKDFVRELYRRLTRDGVPCFFDAESIGWGDNWVRALERAIDECDYIVFVLSPDFCNSEWVEVERTSSMANDPSGLKRKVRPLMLRPCRELPTFPRFLRQTQAIDVSTIALFEENYPRICGGFGGVVRDDAILPDRTKLPPVHPLPPRHRMPYQSLDDKFVGRVDAIWNLYDSLFRNRTSVLQGKGVVAGTGGLGKTQLAIEYAHRFGSVYTGGVYWVDADRGFSAMLTQIGGAAGIDLDTKAEEPDQAMQLWRGLDGGGLPYLLVLDNFPEAEALQPYLPATGRVHTIVTTRRQDLRHATVRLPTLSIGEGVQLLNSGARQFGEDAGALVERLGGLPLALELAASYLNYRKDLSISALLGEIRSVGEMEALAAFATEYRDRLPSGHERDVAGTLQMSWNLAPDAARQVLRVMGELAPAPAPRTLLRRVLKGPERPGLRDGLGNGISELERLSLVELDPAGDPRAHRLILAFVRHRNAVDDASPFDTCRETIQEQMQRTFDNPDAGTSRELESLVVHAEFLLATDRLSANESSDLLNRLGQHHSTMGRFAAARDAFSKALTLTEKSFAPGHPSIASRQSNLALVLQDLGQLEEARDLLRKALDSDEKSFAPGHPSIARSQSNLALVLQDLGQLEGARDLLRQALDSDERSFAPGHPSITIKQSNLAGVLRHLGQLEGARDLLRQALDSDEKSFAPGHPSIAISQSNLATVLRDLGQLEEARDLLRQALDSDEKSFAPGHPSIAISQSNLATVLQDLGQLEEARDLLRQALDSYKRSFAPGHPSIARSQSNLALVLRDLGQLEEARDLLRQAYSASKERYGPNHPSTRIFKGNLEALPGE